MSPIKREPSYTVGGNVNWCRHGGEQYGGSLKNKNRVTIWSSNPTPGHISGKDKNSNSKRYMYPMFIAALFTTAKTWKQPKCPLSDEWIKKMWYIYTMEYYSDIKKEWNNAICSNMDGPRDYHTEWRKSDRGRQISYDITYTWNLKYDTNELIYKTEINSQTLKTNLWLPKGKGWEFISVL